MKKGEGVRKGDKRGEYEEEKRGRKRERRVSINNTRMILDPCHHPNPRVISRSV